MIVHRHVVSKKQKHGGFSSVIDEALKPFKLKICIHRGLHHHHYHLHHHHHQHHHYHHHHHNRHLRKITTALADCAKDCDLGFCSGNFASLGVCSFCTRHYCKIVLNQHPKNNIKRKEGECLFVSWLEWQRVLVRATMCVLGRKRCGVHERERGRQAGRQVGRQIDR